MKPLLIHRPYFGLAGVAFCLLAPALRAQAATVRRRPQLCEADPRLESEPRRFACQGPKEKLMLH
jgi:hypothetical protein